MPARAGVAKPTMVIRSSLVEKYIRSHEAAYDIPAVPAGSQTI
jgi:hypothetical protein